MEGAIGPTMIVLETERLVLRRVTEEDAPFILELLNDPDWLRYIGDRKVRTLEDARGYIQTGPMGMYARHGLGLYLTELKDGGAPIGLCGLLRRDGLADPDIGFAFLPAFRGRGYASEAAAATLEYAKNTLGLEKVVAITSPDNGRSVRLLDKLGMRFERMIRLAPEADEVKLYSPAVRPAESTTPAHARKEQK
ncbi:MAG: GNAT family N-acetyltransferase [Acidobacteriota bacterium]